MTPYGYSIHDARAFVEPDEQRRLVELYTAFVAGATLKSCVAASGIPRSAPTCKRMLANKTYLGTDYYPAVIEEGLFRKAQDELRRREEARKPRKRGRYLTCAPVCAEFALASEVAIGSLPSRSRTRYGKARRKVLKPCTPQEWAALQFERIVPAGDLHDA